jgi:protease I
VSSIWVLCSTTALKGRKVTCFYSIKDDVTNAGGTYVDQEVVIDGNVITSRTPEDLPAFVVALMELMRKA